ncbi:IS5 family transposase [Streptomyces sp. NBC_00386]
MGRGDLSDERWAVLEPLLPVTVLGRPSVGRRKLIDGIRWRVRTGAPWRDLPQEYGPWQTVYGLFRRWQRDGVWPVVLTGLQARADAAGLITWEVNVDSTICRAHQHAAGARRNGQDQKEPPGGTRTEPDDHGLGRSRGGFTTKVHLVCRVLSRRHGPMRTSVLHVLRGSVHAQTAAGRSFWPEIGHVGVKDLPAIRHCPADHVAVMAPS